MWSVFQLQWVRLKRDPILALSFLVLTFVFVFLLAGSQSEQILTVQTYSDDLAEQEAAEWLTLLNDSGDYQFEWNDSETVRDMVEGGRISFALQLDQDRYHYLIGQESHYYMAVNQHVERVYRETLRIREVEEQFGEVDLQSQISELDPLMQTEVTALMGEGSRGDVERFHVVIGMTVYFAIFTLLFSVTNIITEKRTGTWNRVILSPVNKAQVYLGQLMYCFVIGISQIFLSFLLFHYFLGYDFGDQIFAIIVVVSAYVFAIVALGMLVMGLVQSPQQLQAVNPIVATGMAMLGGAFWPIELISNQIMIALSKAMPIFYGMDGLIGAILYDQGIAELLEPISILLLMGVVFMGVGVNLMERVKT